MSLLLATGPQIPEVAADLATAADWWLLGLYLFLALGVSFICSLLEAGILSLPISHVHVMIDRGAMGGRLLEAMKANIDRPLAAILTLNTFAHTIGAAGAGAQIFVIFGNAYVAVGSGIVTLLILVLSEIIPKSLGAAHTKRLAPFTALAIQGMIWLTLPLVIPLQWLSNALRGRAEQVVTRDEVAITAELGHQAGQIDPGESKAIANLLQLSSIPVKDIMTPRLVMFTLPESATVRQILDGDSRPRFSRIPVYRGDTDHVTGYITRHALLTAGLDGQKDTPLSELARPIIALNEDTPVDGAMQRLVNEHEHIALVLDEFEATAGLLTQEDCIETLLGVEIVDETDTVEDMRQAARDLMARRRRGDKSNASD